MGFKITKDGVLKKYTGKDEIVEIPDSVIEIGESAFSNRELLKEVVIPNSVTEIGNYAFFCCSSLKEVVIPDSITTIGYAAFYCCESLEKVDIPNSVTTIGDRAFCGCHSLKEVVIPNNVKEIGYSAFSNCESLKEVVIPNSVTEIGDSAFYSCRSLKKVVIPDSVTTIGGYAFFCCSSLKEVVIPDSVTEIGNNAFHECISLKKVVIPDSLTKIGDKVFYGCESLQDENGFVIVNNVLFNYYGKDEIVEIPDSVTKIEINAFFRCTSLKEVVIPNSVTTIGYRAFEDCESLKEVVIPDSVTKIGDFTFYDCTSLKKVVIPDSVTKIGNYAFWCCTSLKELVIPNSVKEIRNGAFSWCVSLKKVVIPDSVNQIGARAFYECNSVTFPANVKLKLGKKHNDYLFENISDDLNKYINQFTKVFLYLDNYNSYSNLNYKTDIPSIINFNIRGYEDIEISDEERKIILNQLKEKCNEDENFYIPLAVFGDDDTVNELIDIINVWAKGKKKDKERLMRVKGALLLNDTMAAQKYFEKIDKLELYAKKRGLDVDDLRDQVLSDFGLDENGQTKYVLEGKVITASLQNDLKFILTDGTGKVIKSISKKTDEGKKANDEFTKLKKDIKSAAKMTKDRMFKDFLSGKTRDGRSWKNIWLNNPVMKIMARLVVWQQGDNTFTIHEDNKAYLVDNNVYEITGEAIKVAHPMEMKKRVLNKWQEYFVSNNLKQPFEQVWEPVYKASTIKANRYKNAYIPLYVLMNKDRDGIIMKGQSELLLQDCSANLKLIEGHSDWINNQFEITNFKFDKYTRYVNHIVSIFDKGTVEGRIKKDDTSVSLYLDRFTLAQITNFIDIAAENKCTNVAALLLQYKQDNYPDYDVMDEFVLDL